MIKCIKRRKLVQLLPLYCSVKRYVHAPAVLNWEDPLDSASLFNEEERAIQETAKSYCQERMLPRVLGMQL